LKTIGHSNSTVCKEAKDSPKVERELGGATPAPSKLGQRQPQTEWNRRAAGAASQTLRGSCCQPPGDAWRAGRSNHACHGPYIGEHRSSVSCIVHCRAYGAGGAPLIPHCNRQEHWTVFIMVADERSGHSSSPWLPQSAWVGSYAEPGEGNGVLGAQQPPGHPAIRVGQGCRKRNLGLLREAAWLGLLQATALVCSIKQHSMPDKGLSLIHAGPRTTK